MKDLEIIKTQTVKEARITPETPNLWHGLPGFGGCYGHLWHEFVMSFDSLKRERRIYTLDITVSLVTSISYW